MLNLTSIPERPSELIQKRARAMWATKYDQGQHTVPRLVRLSSVLGTPLTAALEAMGYLKANQEIEPHVNYAALDSKASIIAVEGLKDALVFDGRDNEEMKRSFYSRLTGMDYSVELI